MKQDQAPAGGDSDPQQAARSAGLVYVGDEEPGIRREPAAQGVRYLHPNGSPVRDERTLDRIRGLAIPPAWTEVWICPSPDGHLQATGRDARGRKQYRYHPRFRELREENKYGRMIEFAQALPQLRAALAQHMALRGLPREKVLATVVHLLESTLIRVGNDDYARQNRSFGLTTLRDRHVEVEGAQLRFRFKGKSGKSWQLQLHDRRVARVVRACQELPGQRLFQYADEAGELREVTSTDVNADLREISGRDITAKDFRTWAGTVMAAFALQAIGPADATRKAVRDAVAAVAARLGNTPTICRKCYVHPEVFAAWQAGELVLAVESVRVRDATGGLRPEEAAVLALLQARLSRTVEGDLARSLAALGPREGARRRRGGSKRLRA
ncbi:DNA topoisomerase IB [Ramlibacter sp.]|uniref:DNA topoisomerase IB n=1 Tax=Ramlibacter sp. TaxID=1917967 RepID=UPI002D3DC833|nr:DNA topoisomerase IB [Ramlibacter sp.]HYD75848.1 DNA topoisomerase IB [Ramlibacter sp.]